MGCGEARVVGACGSSLNTTGPNEVCAGRVKQQKAQAKVLQVTGGVQPVICNLSALSFHQIMVQLGVHTLSSCEHVRAGSVQPCGAVGNGACALVANVHMPARR